MEIRWSTEAAADLEQIYHHIRQENPTAAREVIQHIYNGCAVLSESPQLGRVSRLQGRRELVFAPTP